MTTTHTTRYPDLEAVPRAPLRAAAARLLVRLVAARVPIRVVPDDGDAVPGGPVLRLHRPADLYRRLGARGMIGLGEA